MQFLGYFVVVHYLSINVGQSFTAMAELVHSSEVCLCKGSFGRLNKPSKSLESELGYRLLWGKYCSEVVKVLRYLLNWIGYH